MAMIYFNHRKEINKLLTRKELIAMTTKQVQAKIPFYEKSVATNLNHIYGSYSQAKYKAYRYCRNLCEKLDGFEFKLVTHNSMVFTAGFKFVDKETGVLKFAYITRDYNYFVDYIY